MSCGVRTSLAAHVLQHAEAGAGDVEVADGQLEGERLVERRADGASRHLRPLRLTGAVLLQ